MFGIIDLSRFQKVSLMSFFNRWNIFHDVNYVSDWPSWLLWLLVFGTKSKTVIFTLPKVLDHFSPSFALNLERAVRLGRKNDLFVRLLCKIA